MSKKNNNIIDFSKYKAVRDWKEIEKENDYFENLFFNNSITSHSPFSERESPLPSLFNDSFYSCSSLKKEKKIRCKATVPIQSVYSSCVLNCSDNDYDIQSVDTIRNDLEYGLINGGSDVFFLRVDDE